MSRALGYRYPRISEPYVFDYLITKDEKAVLVQNDFKRTIIHIAAINGWSDMIYRIGKTVYAADIIDTKDNSKMTAMHCAAKNETSDCVVALLKSGSAAINCASCNIGTPIMEAAFGGCIETVKLISNMCPISLTSSNWNKECVLHSAVLGKNKETIEFLLQTDYNFINIVDGDGETPFDTAISFGYADVAELLLRYNVHLLDDYSNGKKVLRIHFPPANDRKATEKMFLMLDNKIPVGGQLSWSEDEAINLRYRVYFMRSLVHRLLWHKPSKN
jgi:ankyrin repeat protein